MLSKLSNLVQGFNMTAIPDATGRSRRCTPIGGRATVRAYPAEPDPDRIKPVRDRLSGPTILLGLLAFAPVTCLAQSLTNVWFGRIEAGLVLGACAVLAVVLVVVIRRPLERDYRAEHTAACLDATLCPWCLYDLRDTVAADDALTTCPECGGVWRLPTPTPASDAPHPPPTRAG